MTTRAQIQAAYKMAESDAVEHLLSTLNISSSQEERIAEQAHQLVEHVRANRRQAAGLDIFLHEYDLSTTEGVTLMCLAESLLRVPDKSTADLLIRDKIAGHDWAKHLGHSDSLFVNASTWALMLTGSVVQWEDEEVRDVETFLGALVAKSGEPIIRQALTHAMHIIGDQFVMGETIDASISRATEGDNAKYRYSFDMLGEAARTAQQVKTYFSAYQRAIEALRGIESDASLYERPGISVKLSALHPRYEYGQRDRVLKELTPKVLVLAQLAKACGISLCLDAEEADRLELSLDILAVIAEDKSIAGWDGLGLAVQAYQKRALVLIDWLIALADRTGRRLMVRLVKGAYWDSEIKRAQVEGLSEYPVYTRKESTDISYLACAQKILENTEQLYPQFATHNAHTIAAVTQMAESYRDFEFQRLHGMGEALYDNLLQSPNEEFSCRVYAPVGGHTDLLAYLVRRLLENGVNTSFVNRLADDELPIEEVIASPIDLLKSKDQIPSARIPLPPHLYGDGRLNSSGLDLSDPMEVSRLTEALEKFYGVSKNVLEASDDEIEQAVKSAVEAAGEWDRTLVEQRSEILKRCAERFEQNRDELIALCIEEAGKTIPDSVSEIREAVDFLRYYAAEAEVQFRTPKQLPGPTGENNQISLHGRGVFACISPWNFPLAIFAGQVSAALAAGNSVVAKPAEQTPGIAARAVELMHDAGVPEEVLHLLPGKGSGVGARLVADPRVSGVAFTGSFETAKIINQRLAERSGAIVPLIAETGGINAMIVDSTALPEQVVDDVLASCFQSAGQRCSALRILLLQDEVADDIIDMLCGKAAELVIGDPALLSTDVGPVIDLAAKQNLLAHAQQMDEAATLLFKAKIHEDKNNKFVAPRIYLLDHINQLEREVFGPILHIVRYQADEIDRVIGAINGTGFGLTLGIHSRIDRFARYLHERLKVGNTYINRNMIGAVVGVQPFGGEGLSGTGPKAGGEQYLHRFAVERTLTINTSAIGGNAALLSRQ